MSRIGKLPIKIPAGVTVTVNGQDILVKGPKGELKNTMPEEINAEVVDNNMVFSIARGSKKAVAFWGLTRALVNNMVKGVVDGFEKKLEIEGVGYKAVLTGNDLVLSLGFSHPINVKAPQGITFKVEKNVITISGIDKQAVGQISAEIRAEKKPEPYKGKGIHYLGEVVRRKAGKKATASS